MAKLPNESSLRPPAKPARRYPYIITALLCLVIGLYIFGPQATDQAFQLPNPSTEPYRCDLSEPIRRVAVIGAGSAGSSAAYNLHKYTHGCPSIQTTVFERSSHIGGRSTTVNAYDSPDEPVELGASIFVKVNKNLVSAVEEFGLATHGFRRKGEEELPDTLGVYDGATWHYIQDGGDYGWWNIAKLLWKYGITPARTNTLMKKTVGEFLRMYEKPHFPFGNVSETALSLGLSSATGMTGNQFLEANNLKPPFTTDIIQASTRVNYAANLDQIHGLETMVCMATDGAMSVKGGNWQIFDSMLAASGADVMLNTSVSAIQKQPDGTFSVLYKMAAQQEDDSNGPSGETATSTIFDTIIIAAPFQYANITFEPAIFDPPAPIPYVNLHVTLFTSPHQLDGKRLGIGFVNSIPTTILTTTNPNGNETLPYYSISTLRVVRNPKNGEKEYLYKIFSPESIKPTFLNALLFPPSHSPYPYDTYSPKDITWMHEKVWQSYPILAPRTTFDNIQLDDEGRVFYTGGIESFISTMETSSLMGMNVARLVVDGLMGVGMRMGEGDDGGREGGGGVGDGGRGVNSEL